MKLRPFVSIDLETTGVSITQDAIVQVAVIKFDPADMHNSIAEFQSLVKPGVPISQGAIDVHGITAEMVAMAPTFAEVFPEILAICQGCDLVGYNLKKFDLPLLLEECHRAGVEFGSWEHVIFDACQIFQVMEPHTLAGAIKFYTGEVAPPESLHDAMADARYTTMVIQAQLKEYDLPINLSQAVEQLNEQLGKSADMAGFLGYDGTTMVFDFGMHKGRPITLEKSYCNWMLGGEFPHETKQLIRKELGI